LETEKKRKRERVKYEGGGWGEKCREEEEGCGNEPGR
jgi:hypothetical protein